MTGGDVNRQQFACGVHGYRIGADSRYGEGAGGRGEAADWKRTAPVCRIYVAMPSYPHIERYHVDRQRLIDFGGSDSEMNIRRAFAVCLDSYCREHREKLALIEELGASLGNRPDGTVKDSLRMSRGYWEAKDSRDDLDAEIQRKFNRGYPTDNIIFEDSQTAVLFQNRQQAMRVDMSRPGELHRLIKAFLDYELPEIEEFRRAQQQFKADLPSVLDNLREAVEEAEAGNPDYQVAAAGFLELCRQSIGPAVTSADVREMLLQHILTQDIFLRVFREDQFHRENNIARQLTALAGNLLHRRGEALGDRSPACLLRRHWTGRRRNS